MSIRHRMILLISLALIAAVLLSGCKGSSAEINPTPDISVEQEDEQEGDAFIGVPNPASFYCTEMGYDLEMRETKAGTQGICIFPDGSECEEWDFLAGRCGAVFSYCQRQGYTIKPGDSIGTCEFPNGSSCSEYEMFIRECKPPR